MGADNVSPSGLSFFATALKNDYTVEDTNFFVLPVGDSTVSHHNSSAANRD